MRDDDDSESKNPRILEIFDLGYFAKIQRLFLNLFLIIIILLLLIGIGFVVVPPYGQCSPLAENNMSDQIVTHFIMDK